MKVTNPEDTVPAVIVAQMGEPRPLPIGRQEFDEWADRIISGALVPADIPSQKFALANLILHLGPTESHKPDAFFIHSLRKFASNQVADAVRTELYAARKTKEDAATAELREKAANEAPGLTLIQDEKLTAVKDAHVPTA